jgi:hypothetical protein
MEASNALAAAHVLRCAAGSVTIRAIVGATMLPALLATWACGSSPVAPSSSEIVGVPRSTSDVVLIQISCGGIAPGQVVSLVVGETRHLCGAQATHSNGASSDIGLEAVWSVANPQIASAGPATLPSGTNEIAITGLSPGQTTVSATYGGRTGVQAVSVTAEDRLRCCATASRGDFRPGSTVTMWAIGDYSVASAAVGELTLRISDESSIVMTKSTTAFKNFNSFVLEATFTVPSTSLRLCRTVVLQVSSLTLSGGGSGVYCEAVRQ